jgi:prevent-host-death family protein
MKRASISEAKNRLSALLDRVRQGSTVVIEDRGLPIARLEPIRGGGDAYARLLALERRGVIRQPSRKLTPSWLKVRPPRLLHGRHASDLLIEERSEGR